MTYVLFQSPAESSAMALDGSNMFWIFIRHTSKGDWKYIPADTRLLLQRSKLSQFQVGFKSNALQSFLIKSKQLFGLTFTNLKQCVQSLLK